MTRLHTLPVMLLAFASIAVAANAVASVDSPARARLQGGASSAVIPITTTSAKAMSEFTKGRELFERLRFREATPHFEAAVADDPNFALAYFYLALNALTNQEFLENVRKASALADKVSEGERLEIESLQANMNGDRNKQEELLRTAISRYPDDTRAHALLAGVLLTRQKFDDGIAECKRALALDPAYAPADNTLGYIEFGKGDYGESEKAFKAYIALVPGEPNPYDSYAELLLKEGKFSESIDMYEKALAIDPQFISSVVGIANDYALKEQYAEARDRLKKAYETAPDAAAKRQLLTGMAMVALFQGDYRDAMQQIENRRNLDEGNKDVLAVNGDLNEQGDILLMQSGITPTKTAFLKTRSTEPSLVTNAAKDYDDAVSEIQKSSLDKDIKDQAELRHLYAEVEVALHNNDIATAKSKADDFRRQAEARNQPASIRDSHYLDGSIALAEGRNDDAITELNQADMRNPRTLLYLAVAYAGTGNSAKARQLREEAVHFNENDFNFALIRTMAME